MAREDHQLKFRVPAILKAKLEAYAEQNKRSLNAEIIARLEESLPDPDARERREEERYRLRLQAEKDETVRMLKDMQERLDANEGQLSRG